MGPTISNWDPQLIRAIYWPEALFSAIECVASNLGNQFLAPLRRGNSRQFQFQLAPFRMTGNNSGNGPAQEQLEISNWDPQLSGQLLGASNANRLWG
jgi:hypothetical protein